MLQFTLLFYTFPPSDDFCCLGNTITEMAAKTAPMVSKPLLVCQSWVTKADGCQILVPGLHSYRRGRRGLSYTTNTTNLPRFPARIIVARFFVKFYLFFIMYFIFRYFS